MKYELFVERSYKPFIYSMFGGIFQKGIATNFVDEEECVSINTKFYYTEGGFDKIRDWQLNNLNKFGYSWIWDLCKTFQTNGTAVLTCARNIRYSELYKLSNSDIIKQLAKLKDLSDHFFICLFVPWVLGEHLEKEIEKTLKKKNLTDAEFEKVNLAMTQPLKFNNSQNEMISFNKIALAHHNKNEREFHDRAYHHIEQYGWMQSRGYYGQAFSEEDLKKRAQKMLAAKSVQEITDETTHLENNTQRTIDETTKYFEKYNFSLEERELVWIAKEYIYLRTFRTDILNQMAHYVLPLLHESARRLEVSCEDVVYFTVHEIMRALEHGVVGLPEILRRKESRATRMTKNGFTYVQGDDAVALFKSELGIVDDATKEKSELRGKSAFKGKVTGKAKILHTPEDINKVNVGDILIAQMTFPSYIAAMERAAAFVTDEGGILCHAAIIAREMKKPCVIGTKEATKVFKDGDMVEVDAITGVVKKVDSAST
jgi:phosphohistidine swiveling domain-containing protein